MENENMHTKKRNRMLLIGYAILIIACMFLGFGRISRRHDTFQMSFTITGIPLWIPKHVSFHTLQIWIFALGNLVAFIPFGVLIPLNFKSPQKLFLKSTVTFMIGITILEILQMLSLLGSFDVEDILINTLGFMTGYISWKFSKTASKLSHQILRFCIACIVAVVIIIICAEMINPLLR